jgi:hypothetical protein
MSASRLVFFSALLLLSLTFTTAQGATTLCSRPTIDQPTGSAFDVTVSTRRPVITGTSDCAFVTIQITSQGTVVVPVIDGGYTYQPNSLINGRYAISVAGVSDRQRSNAGPGIARTMDIQSTEPEPSVRPSDYHAAGQAGC